MHPAPLLQKSGLPPSRPGNSSMELLSSETGLSLPWMIRECFPCIQPNVLVPTAAVLSNRSIRKTLVTTLRRAGAHAVAALANYSICPMSIVVHAPRQLKNPGLNGRKATGNPALNVGVPDLIPSPELSGYLPNFLMRKSTIQNLAPTSTPSPNCLSRRLISYFAVSNSKAALL